MRLIEFSFSYSSINFVLKSYADVLSTLNLLMSFLTGTGPSCIFPLLGADHCGWKFCATEINEESMTTAKLNVKNNGLKTKITVVRAHESSFFRVIHILLNLS